MDEDGRYETMTTFKGAVPVRQIRDINMDGKFDVSTAFENGSPGPDHGA